MMAVLLHGRAHCVEGSLEISLLGLSSMNDSTLPLGDEPKRAAADGNENSAAQGDALDSDPVSSASIGAWRLIVYEHPRARVEVERSLVRLRLESFETRVCATRFPLRIAFDSRELSLYVRGIDRRGRH